MTDPSVQRIRLAIAGVNGFFLAVFLWSLDLPSLTLRVILWTLFGLGVLSALFARSSGTLAQWLQNLQLSVLGICVFCLLLEPIKWVPKIIPAQIRDYLLTDDLPRIRDEVVEYLDRSPYVKFRPGVHVRSQGYRGSADQFVYEWKTDRLGFKNADDVAARERFDTVALGDSFTEGMGVAVEDTWPAILASKGMTTYNLGVQGYAPIQLEGSYREYGRRLAPRWVIIGYCSNTYEREAAFLDEQSAMRDRRFTGGIASFVGIREVRRASAHVASALYLFVADSIAAVARVARAPNPQNIVDPALKRYAGEINAASTTVAASSMESSATFGRALQAFSRIHKMAEAQGARVLMVYLPQRGEIYYQRATGKAPDPQRFHAVESSLLRRFSEQEGIGFLDASPLLAGYVNSLPASAPMRDYPYLEIDGHMSPVGYRLVAEQVAAYLKRPGGN